MQRVMFMAGSLNPSGFNFLFIVKKMYCRPRVCLSEVSPNLFSPTRCPSVWKLAEWYFKKRVCTDWHRGPKCTRDCHTEGAVLDYWIDRYLFLLLMISQTVKLGNSYIVCPQWLLSLNQHPNNIYRKPIYWSSTPNLCMDLSWCD